MNPHNGTSILDWGYFESQSKKMSDEQLIFAIEDCKRAESNGIEYASFPCKASGFYTDLKCVYSDELRKRRKSKRKLTIPVIPENF